MAKHKAEEGNNVRRLRIVNYICNLKIRRTYGDLKSNRCENIMFSSFFFVLCEASNAGTEAEPYDP